MNNTRWAVSVAAMAVMFCVCGCVTSQQRPVAAQAKPQPVRATVVVATPPAAASRPRPTVAPRPVMVEQVLPEPNDVYISAAANSDIVFVGGSTYIWVTGPDGLRHRHFYGHGDRRAEIYHRRENLRSVGAPRPLHPAPRYVAHTNGHAPVGAHRLRTLQAKGGAEHAQTPQRKLASNNPPHQAHQPGQQSQHAARQNPGVRTVSTGNAGVHHRPAPTLPATKSDAPART